MNSIEKFNRQERNLLIIGAVLLIAFALKVFVSIYTVKQIGHAKDKTEINFKRTAK